MQNTHTQGIKSVPYNGEPLNLQNNNIRQSQTPMLSQKERGPFHRNADMDATVKMTTIQAHPPIVRYDDEEPIEDKSQQPNIPMREPSYHEQLQSKYGGISP